MTTLLYPGFLNDPEEYAASERFWSHLLREVVAERGQPDDWMPWRPRAFLNGTPFDKDGNPIFDARSDRLGKAVRVIQFPPDGDDLQVAAWTSEQSLGDEHDCATVQELTINCTLSVEVARLAKDLLRAWLNPEIGPGEMRMAIPRILAGWD